jgi:hypothetical protein
MAIAARRLRGRNSGSRYSTTRSRGMPAPQERHVCSTTPGIANKLRHERHRAVAAQEIAMPLLTELVPLRASCATDMSLLTELGP